MKWVCNKIYKNQFNLYQHSTFVFVKHTFAITRRKSCLVFECNFDVKSKFRDFNRQLLDVKMWVQDTRKKGKAGSFIWGMGKWFSYGHVISHHWTHNCHDFCLNSPDLHSLVFSSVCCFFFWLLFVSTSQNKGSDAFSSTSTQLKPSLRNQRYVVQIPWFDDKFSEFEIKVVWHRYFILWKSFII